MGRKKIEKDYNSVFATNLRSVMKEKKITQQEIADVIGMTRQVVSQYQDGSTLPNIETLCKIARHLDVSSDFLLGLSNVESRDVNLQMVSDYTGLSEKALEVLNPKNLYDVNSIVNELLLSEHIGNPGSSRILSKISQYINSDIDTLCDNYISYNFVSTLDSVLYTGFDSEKFVEAFDVYLRSEITRSILDFKNSIGTVVTSHNDVMKNIDDSMFDEEEFFLQLNDIPNGDE